MRLRLLVIACTLILASCASSGTDRASKAPSIDKQAAVDNVTCSDINYGSKVTSQFPEIDRACRGVVLAADGSPYIKVEGVVKKIRRDRSGTRVTLNMVDKQDKSLRYLTVRPPEDFRYMVDGRTRTLSFMKRGQDLRMYIPADRWELNWDIDNAMPVDTVVNVEDIETFLVTASLQADEAFEFDSAKLSNAGRADLDGILGAIGDYVPLITIYGYTDRIGAEDYNLGLSQRRADAARDYLVSLGAPADRVEAVGRGESGPIVACQGVSGDELKTCLGPNRRTEVMFLIPAVADIGSVGITKSYVDPLGRPVTKTEQLAVAKLGEISDAANDVLDSCAAEIRDYCDIAQAGNGRVLGCLTANKQAGFDFTANCDASLLTVVDAVAYRRTRLNAIGSACSKELAVCHGAPLGTKLECVAKEPQSSTCAAAMSMLASAAF